MVHSCRFLGQIARSRLCCLPPTGRTLLLHPWHLLATLRPMHRDVPGGAPLAGIPGLSWAQGQEPPVWVIVVLVLLFGFFGVDGANSFLHFIPNFSGLYEPTNLLRLITGMGVGLGIGTVLYALFNRTAWSNWVDESPYRKWFAFPLLLILAAVLIVLIQTNHPVVIYPVMVISGLGVFVVLSSVYTVVALMILRRENVQLFWRELLLPILIGMTIALLQVLLTAWLRFLLTGTWESLNL